MLCIYREVASFAGGVGRQPCASGSDFWNHAERTPCQVLLMAREKNYGQFLTEPPLFTGIGQPTSPV
jgi:hypothetical protein